MIKSLIALSVFLAVAAATCSNNAEPTPVSFSPGNCDWYSASACCTAASADLTISVIKPLYNFCGEIATGCMDYVILSACSDCSPNEKENNNKVCANFADKLYSACKSEILPFGGICTKMSTIHANAQSFAGISYEPSNTGCFNAGVSVVPALFLIASILAVFLF